MAQEYIDEMDEQSGIEGYDPENLVDRIMACQAVAHWRETNPSTDVDMFMVEHETLSGWEAMETTQNAIGETCRVTYTTEAEAFESIKDYVTEVLLQVESGERDASTQYYTSEFRVVPFISS